MVDNFSTHFTDSVWVFFSSCICSGSSSGGGGNRSSCLRNRFSRFDGLLLFFCFIAVNWFLRIIGIEDFLFTVFLVEKPNCICYRPFWSIFYLIINFADLKEFSWFCLDRYDWWLFPFQTIVWLSTKLSIIQRDNVETLMLTWNFWPNCVEFAWIRFAMINREHVLPWVPFSILHQDLYS